MVSILKVVQEGSKESSAVYQQVVRPPSMTCPFDDILLVLFGRLFIHASLPSQSAALSEKIAECKRMISALPGGGKAEDELAEKLELAMKRHKRKRCLDETVQWRV